MERKRQLLIPSHSEVRKELDRILDSDIFARSNRMARFLRFIVEMKLDGRPGRVTERQIADAVFDRSESFDPRVDPIVRVEVGRLRTKLRDYYQSIGGWDPVVINVPRRRYLPVFERRADARPVERPGSRAVAGRASVAVLPLADLDPEQDSSIFCAGLTAEIINGLGRIKDIRVAAGTSTREWADKAADVRKLGEVLNAQGIVEGTVRRKEDRVRVAVRLVNTSDGCCLWTRGFDFNRTDEIEAQIRVADAVVSQLAEQLKRVPVS